VKGALTAAGLGLALCLVAAGFSAAPLYLPGVALLLLASVATVWVRVSTAGMRVERSVVGASVEEGAPLELTVSVSRGALAPPTAVARTWPGGEPLAIPRDRVGTLATAVRFPSRGRRALGPASVQVADPLGLCSRIVVSSAGEVLVLPRIEPVRFARRDDEAAMSGRRLAPARGLGGTEVDSLQPHQPGTPASRIHWPTVARTRSLMERRLIADGERMPLIVIDPRGPSSAEALDQAVRAAASLCVHLARLGGCALLLPGDRRPVTLDPGLASFPGVHARLALLEPASGAPPLGFVSAASTLLWVTGAAAPSAALARLRAPVRYLVTPHVDPRWPVSFSVAGCGARRLDRDAGDG
jgi:uncharacterized protein (DUF58 family)